MIHATVGILNSASIAYVSGLRNILEIENSPVSSVVYILLEKHAVISVKKMNLIWSNAWFGVCYAASTAAIPLTNNFSILLVDWSNEMYDRILNGLKRVNTILMWVLISMSGIGFAVYIFKGVVNY